MRTVLFALFWSSILTLSAHAGWQQTWSDEFNGTAVDRGKWQTIDSFGTETLSGGGVQEAQCFKDAGTSVAAGYLVLTATKQTFTACRNVPPANMGAIQYQSGRVVTWNHFSQLYGYFEARIKFPPGAGMWPAFWLLENSGWPPEIDIVEWVGKDPLWSHLTYHWNPGTGHVGDGTGVKADVPWSDGWHTWGVDWTPGQVVWYVDGVEKKRLANAYITAKPNYILINLTLGGAWGGPVDNSKIPAQMLVDYVRVWQRVADGKPDNLPPSATPPPTTAVLPPKLMLSLSPDRSTPTDVSVPTTAFVFGATKAYLWAQADPSAAKVEFWLDTATTMAPTHVENLAPWDFVGTAADQSAMPYDLGSLTTGPHSMSIRATLKDGTVQPVVTAKFSVLSPPSAPKVIP